MANSREALQFSSEKRVIFEPYLPTPENYPVDRAWCTLTYATSLDAQIAFAPGTQTALSGPESKAMTHYLRSRHDAILIGEGTMLADNPSLNCRLEGSGGYGGSSLKSQPTPIILSPQGGWREWWKSAKIYTLAKEKKGKPPYIFTVPTSDASPPEGVLELGGGVIEISLTADQEEAKSHGRMEWLDILKLLKRLGFNSVMVEGGGRVINSLLEPRNQALIDSTILTIAPTWLGHGGVVVSPERPINGNKPMPIGRLKNTVWVPLGEDVVLCGKIAQSEHLKTSTDDNTTSRKRKFTFWTQASIRAGPQVVSID